MSHGEFDSLKEFRLEDMGENVTVMVTIIKLTQYGMGTCNIQNCFVHPKDFTVSTEILNLRNWSDDTSNEIEN